ncbi:RdgB/HAM1 family non-canonical purine NTP pyrophosphatase [Aquirufa sp. OSTEICH-129V]|uniref:dITP/XTP pyrophosphatase n=1 Tax=Aquirufa avitistagni TaxID=3104728 RepID=A0ABW6DFQ1_9BACT
MKPIIYLATQNQHKIDEIKDLLGDLFDFRTVFELGLVVEIPETGSTLAENSRQKAEFIVQKFGGITCLADDSGLEVDALNGAPGVYSARYAGEAKSDTANVAKLLQVMANEPNRNARFVTVLTLHHQGQIYVFEGEVHGQIQAEPRGTQGFGYDPIFVPTGIEQTFAELSLAEKNQLAHRARALEKFKMFVQDTQIFG